MVPIPANSTVLVSGASGFVAAWCCRVLLQRGHRVRGACRSEEKAQYLQQLFDRDFPGQFETVMADDLETPGVFDEAVKGVDGVLHTASPFHFNAEGKALTALINPALKGTENMLQSCLKHGDKLKRVVITSSFAAILDTAKPVPQNYTEEDWNETSIKESERDGEAQEPVSSYRASKSYAERAAWAFVEREQPSWDLATINPPYIIGPPIHPCASAEKLNTSSKTCWAILHGSKKEDDMPGPLGCVVDVRNVADAHVMALLHTEAGGNRFAPTIGKWTLQDVADIVHSSARIPAEWRGNVPTGKPQTGGAVVQNGLSGEKTAKVLGVQYHTLQNTFEATAIALKDYETRNWQGLPDPGIFELH